MNPRIRAAEHRLVRIVEPTMRQIASLVTGLLLSLAGCAGVVEPGGGRVADCRAVFAEIDGLVEAAGVRDAEAAKVSGFPYLRVNRFLASFRREPMERARRDAWVERMRALDRQARWVELANLPLFDQSDLRAFLAGVQDVPAEPISAVEHCADVLWRHAVRVLEPRQRRDPVGRHLPASDRDQRS